MSNLIPITKIYDIYPKYTFSKDVMRFMDDIVDIPRAEVFTKDEVIAMFAELQSQMANQENPYGFSGSGHGGWQRSNRECQDLVQEKINVLKEAADDKYKSHESIE